jgi:hypothetical protein
MHRRKPTSGVSEFMLVALLAATMLMADASTAAPANPPAPASAAQPDKKKTEDQQVVCKSEVVLGSRMPVKKCRTASQAAADKQNAREELERAQGAQANNPH